MMASYYPYYSPYASTPAVQPPGQASGSMIWVQGEAGAKSYITPPNTTVLLMNSEADQFFIKSVDASGMPSPLRVFDYTEVTSKGTVTPDVAYVTKEEFNAFKEELKPKRKVKTDEQSV